MNRLKYVFGISVPRHVPPNSVILTERQSNNVYKRHQSDVSLPKSTRIKKASHFKSFHCTGQVKNGTVALKRSKNKSLERIFPEKPIESHCNAMCEVQRLSSGTCCDEKNDLEGAAVLEVQMLHEIDGLVQKEARSYAEMIASYHETFYGTSSNSGVLRDRLSSAIINGTRRSPFSTASLVSIKLKSTRRAIKSANICAANSNVFNQDAKFSSDASPTRYQNHYENKLVGSNELEKTPVSYATMIEKYSNAMNLTSVDNVNRSSNYILKRNVSTKFNENLVVPLQAKDLKNNSSETAWSDENKDVTETLTKRNESRKAQDQDDWTTKVDDIVKDLKRVISKTETNETQSNDKWMLQSVNEHAYWLDRVVTAHKKSVKEREPTPSKDTAKKVNSASKEDVQPVQPNSYTTTGNSMASILNENEGNNPPPRYPLVMTRDKPSNPMAEYIRRGPANSSKSPRSSSTPTNTAATNPTREPQIELRMTPSQNESVVSINVDEGVAKTAGAGNQEQLSVVISSRRNEAGRAGAGNASNVNSDFGSMQISISENTVPVKQIEFSINGKPVSELKSILARADKLDVVSSMDKVEIRIPSKSNASVSNEQPRNIAGARSSSKPVLNLQIAAKFNEPRYQQPRGAEMKTDPPRMPPPGQPAQPTPPPTPRIPPVPSRPPRQHNLFNPDGTDSGATNSELSRGEATRTTTENVDGSNATHVDESRTASRSGERVDSFSGTTMADSLQKEGKTSSVTKGASLTAKPEEAAVRRNANVSSTTNPVQSKVDNESKDRGLENRSSSNIIPWWSSEDSFQKIRKANSRKTESTVDHIRMLQQREEKLPEKKLNSNVTPPKKEDSVDPKKTDIPDDNRKDATPKSPVNDDSEKTDLPDPIVNIVRVRSPQRWVPAKFTNEMKGSPLVGSRRVPTSGRVGKRSKYRVRGNVHSKRSSDAQTISAVSPPKIVKFVPVEPRPVSVGKAAETKASSAKVVVDDRRKTEKAKLETESKTETKTEKAAVEEANAQQIGKANVQHSNKLLKEERDVRGGANESADVSAKSVSPAGKIGLGKEEKRRDEAAGAAESDLPSKHINEEQRIKEILKSMKPIEKRKDGTLIDYGVTVPSRKPSKKVKQAPVVRTKSSVDATQEEPVGRPEKIVEPEKVSSTKKETLTEPKSAVVQTKIVESEKISTAKNPVEVKNNDAKRGTKTGGETKWKLQTEKSVNENMERTGARITKSIFEVEKNATTSKESKSDVSNAKEAASTPRTNQPFKRPSSSGTCKALPDGTLPDQSFRAPQKPNDINAKSIALLDKPKNTSLENSQLQASKKKESKDALKLAEQKKVEKAAAAPSKVVDKPVKSINIPRSSAAKASDSPKPSGKIVVSVDEEKKVSSDLDSQRKSDFSKLDAKKKPSNKGGGHSGSGSPVGAPPTGPGGLTSQLRDKKTPVTCSREEWNRNDKSAGSGQCSDKAYPLLSERPEKDMLYSSWLQRFKGDLDKDKAI